METDFILNTINQWVLNPAFYLDKSNSTDELLNEEKIAMNKCIEIIGTSLNITNINYVPIQAYYKRFMDSIRNNQKGAWNSFGWFIASENHLIDQLKNNRKIMCLKCLRTVRHHTHVKYAVSIKEAEIDYRLKFKFPKSFVVCVDCENSFNVPAPKNYFEGVVAIIIMNVNNKNSNFISITKSLDIIQREFNLAKDKELELANSLREHEDKLEATKRRIVDIIKMKDEMETKFQTEYVGFMDKLQEQNARVETVRTDNHVGKLMDQLEELQLSINEFTTKNAKYDINKYECTICRENSVDVTLSCGHLLCSDCDSKLGTHNQICPFCRSQITAHIKMFVGA